MFAFFLRKSRFFRAAMDGVLDRSVRKSILYAFLLLCLFIVLGFGYFATHLRGLKLLCFFIWSSAIVALIVVLTTELVRKRERLIQRAQLEGHVLVPEWVEHVSWPQGRLWHMPDQRSCQDVASNPKAKLAFLFNVSNAVPFDELWQKFFEGHEHQVVAVVHCTDHAAPSDLKLSFAATRVATAQTAYGAAVPAHQALIKKALEDRNVQGAVLLSAHCVPIKCFADVHKQLLGPDPGPGGSRGRSILNYESRSFDKCSHWHYQTREFMEKYIENSVDVHRGANQTADRTREVSVKTTIESLIEGETVDVLDYCSSSDFTATLRQPMLYQADCEQPLQLNLHHSQEEFYPAAIAIRYSLPCRHGIVTLDVWDKRSCILTPGVEWDLKARGPPESPLTFTALTPEFLNLIANSEVCFLRKVVKTEINMKVLLEQCT